MASYVVSPLGARVNRALVVGALSASESIGRDPAQPFWRAHLDDPTGSVTVTAGGFQPRAAAALASIAPGSKVLVVGKAHLFHARDGSVSPSVRVERVRPVTEEEYGLYLMDAVDHTLRRLDSREAARRTGPTTAVPAAALPAEEERAVRAALASYPEDEAEALRSALPDVLRAVQTGSPPAPPRVGSVRIVRTSPPPPPPAPTDEDRSRSSVLLELIDELAERSADGYADLRDLVRLAGARGIGDAASEELLGQLEESGAIEEPIVGKLRRAT